MQLKMVGLKELEVFGLGMTMKGENFLEYLRASYIKGKRDIFYMTPEWTYSI